MGAILRGLRRFVGWLFGAPFEALPSEFGSGVPAEMRVFQSRMEEAEHKARDVDLPQPTLVRMQTKPVRVEVAENERSFKIAKVRDAGAKRTI